MSEVRERTDGDPGWEPRIVCFFCNWCTYMAADLAGTSRMAYAPNMRVIKVMCSGRVDPQFVLEAFRLGADGVLLGGCHPGDCHYQDGNSKALRRYKLLSGMLETMGIERDRFRLEWISAAEAEKLRSVVDDMVEKVRALGPLDLAVAPEPFELEEPAPALAGAAPMPAAVSGKEVSTP